MKPFVPGQLVDKLVQLNLKYSFTGGDTSITAEHGILSEIQSKNLLLLLNSDMKLY
jgi:hypothetical protein